MTSLTIRDEAADHLLTSRNSALLITDYRPVQVSSVLTMDRRTLVDNIVRVAKTAKVYGLPIVTSTVNVKTGVNKPMIRELQQVLPGIEPLDRTTLNAWEDAEFAAAINATGRKKLLMAALWTEVCLAFPALDSLRDGYDVFPVVDAVGGTSRESHEAGLARILQARGHPTTWVQLICELQRDWNGTETVKSFTGILFDPGVPFVAAERAATA